MDDFKHHVTITHRERPFNGPHDHGEDRSYHMIGTSEQIGAEVARWVKAGLDRTGGPITVTPIHPMNVFDLEKRR